VEEDSIRGAEEGAEQSLVVGPGIRLGGGRETEAEAKAEAPETERKPTTTTRSSDARRKRDGQRKVFSSIIPAAEQVEWR
jgi:hypothetical protein